jgi:hypothetical protein
MFRSREATARQRSNPKGQSTYSKGKSKTIDDIIKISAHDWKSTKDLYVEMHEETLEIHKYI